MKKLNLLFVLFTYVFCHSQIILADENLYGPKTPIVAGDKFFTSMICLCVQGEYGHYKWDGTALKSTGIECAKVDINEYAYFNVIKYGNYTTTISATLKNKKGETIRQGSHTITVIEPSVTNLNISTTGDLKTYNYIKLKLNYNHNISSTNIIKTTIDWTINNAGSVQKFTGNDISIELKNPGSTTITGIVKLSDSANGYYKEFKTTRTINLADGSLETPILISISGPSRLGLGSQGDYYTTSNQRFPNIKYNWTVKGTSISGSSGNLSHEFMLAGSCPITCSATNTKTGKTGNKIVKSVEVIRGGAVKSLPIQSTSYQVINLNDALFVKAAENETEYIQINNNKQIAYQINNLLTGMLVDQGKVIEGSSIDTSTLPKGLYVLTLNDGTITETHKISIK